MRQSFKMSLVLPLVSTLVLSPVLTPASLRHLLTLHDITNDASSNDVSLPWLQTNNAGVRDRELCPGDGSEAVGAGGCGRGTVQDATSQ